MTYPYIAFAEMEYYTTTSWMFRYYVEDTLWFGTRKSGAWEFIKVDSIVINYEDPTYRTNPLPNYYYEPHIANNGNLFVLSTYTNADRYATGETAYPVWVSTNEGRTWTRAANAPAYIDYLFCANGMFCAINWEGWDEGFYVSSDGHNWTFRTRDMHDIDAWGNNAHNFFHVAADGSLYQLLDGGRVDDGDMLYLTSTKDFSVWTEPQYIFTGWWWDGISIASYKDTFVIAGIDYDPDRILVARSLDGCKTWEPLITIDIAAEYGVESFNYWLSANYNICNILLDKDTVSLLFPVYDDDWSPYYWRTIQRTTEDITAATPTWTSTSLAPIQSTITSQTAQDPINGKSWLIAADYTQALEIEGGWYDAATGAYWCWTAPPFNSELIYGTVPYGTDTDYPWLHQTTTAEQGAGYSYSRYAYQTNVYRVFQKGFAYLF